MLDNIAFSLVFQVFRWENPGDDAGNFVALLLYRNKSNRRSRIDYIIIGVEVNRFFIVGVIFSACIIDMLYLQLSNETFLKAIHSDFVSTMLFRPF